MLFYTINNLLILLWAAIFCFYKPSKRKNLIFTIIAFTQLLAVSIIRYNIGYDYSMYVNGFYFMRMDGFETLIYKDWEMGFVLLTKLLDFILPNYLYYMAFFSIIAIVPAAVFIYKNSEVPWISTVLYVNTFLFFMSMNFIRQAVALSLVMLSWHFIKKHKFIPFLLIIIFASLFHQTVFIMIPLYFLIKMDIGIKELIFYAYVLLWFYISSSGFINILTSFFHEEYSGSVFVTEGLSFIYSLLPLTVTVLSFFLSKSSSINITKENKYLINFVLITSIFSITSSMHSILERLSYYSLIFIVLLVPIIYKSVKQNGIYFQITESKAISVTTDKQKKVVSAIILIAILGISYLSFYYGLSENAHGVVPYKSWI